MAWYELSILFYYPSLLNLTKVIFLCFKESAFSHSGPNSIQGLLPRCCCFCVILLMHQLRIL